MLFNSKFVCFFIGGEIGFCRHIVSIIFETVFFGQHQNIKFPFMNSKIISCLKKLCNSVKVISFLHDTITSFVQIIYNFNFHRQLFNSQGVFVYFKWRKNSLIFLQTEIICLPPSGGRDNISLNSGSTQSRHQTKTLHFRH